MERTLQNLVDSSKDVASYTPSELRSYRGRVERTLTLVETMVALGENDRIEGARTLLRELLKNLNKARRRERVQRVKTEVPPDVESEIRMRERAIAERNRI